MEDIRAILKKYWGHDAFRPQQEDIINAVLRGADTLALLPTGGGKSVCYQVPALARPGICLVVSPLIALMKDQVENLKKKGIGALAIYSGMEKKDILRTLENARQDYFKFLYVSPERLQTSLFKEYLPALNINLVAVDEAHCISQWGYDFRPAYLRIAELRKELPGVPVLAVTASATADVQTDICTKLDFQNTTVFRQSFERKNLSYSVLSPEAKMVKLVDIFKRVPGAAIVYCKSRKRTMEVAALLKMHGFSADYYHAGLAAADRTTRQQQWIDNKVRIIVCTNAFGMGIDKPDVRTVVHVDAPNCLENYYQEAGRCGRDGAKAYGVLLFDGRDKEELLQLPEVRYPPFDKIKEVYQSLVHYLQVPQHTGEGQSFNFRFDEFLRNFNLNVHLALYALQALEADGWLAYNENAFMPSTVVFATNKTLLYQFYKDHPQFEQLLTCLLRVYEGIFDYPVFIVEALIGRLQRLTEDDIKQQLKAITAYGIIRYTPQNEEAQIVFLRQRVAVSDLKIDLAAYQQRKAVFAKRVEAMLHYLASGGCRSRQINTYFGDADTGSCAICDNCLQQKKHGIKPPDFDAIAGAIAQALRAQKLTAPGLLIKLTAYKTDAAWQTLHFLQAEKKVQVTPDGLLFLTA